MRIYASGATEISTRHWTISLGFCALIVLCCAKAEAEHWKLYHVSESHFYFYDIDSVAKYKKTARISEKSVVRQIRKCSLAEALREIAEIEMSEESWKRRINTMSVQETKSLYEMRCSQRMYRIISRGDYDREGSLIDGLLSSKWDPVRPNSVIEILCNTVCGNTDSE